MRLEHLESDNGLPNQGMVLNDKGFWVPRSVVLTVNGTEPDADGDVTVAGGGGGDPVVGGTATFALSTPQIGFPDSAEGHVMIHDPSMWEVDANGAYTIELASINRCLMEVGSDDQEVSWTVGALGSTSSQNDGGAYIRYKNAANYYYLDLFNNSPRLIKVVNGTLNVIGNWSSVAVNDVAYVSFVGNAYTVKKNGVTIGSGTDSGVTTGSYAGLKIPNNTTFRWKNLIVTAL